MAFDEADYRRAATGRVRQRQPPHAGGGVEELGDADEGHAGPIEHLDQPCEIHQRTISRSIVSRPQVKVSLQLALLGSGGDGADRARRSGATADVSPGRCRFKRLAIGSLIREAHIAAGSTVAFGTFQRDAGSRHWSGALTAMSSYDQTVKA